MTPYPVKRLREPLPEHYGLTSSRVTELRLRRRRDPLVGAGALLVVLVVALFWGLLSKATMEDALESLLFAGAIGAVCAGMGLLIGAVQRLVPDQRALSQYDASLARYRETCDAIEGQQRRLRSEYWGSLSGVLLELEVGFAFQGVGYAVQRVGAKGDRGIDLIVCRSGRRAIVQCKGWNKPVGPATVRELLGTLTAEAADEAILVAPGGFSASANEAATGRVTLMGIPALISLQEEALVRQIDSFNATLPPGSRRPGK